MRVLVPALRALEVVLVVAEGARVAVCALARGGGGGVVVVVVVCASASASAGLVGTVVVVAAAAAAVLVVAVGAGLVHGLAVREGRDVAALAAVAAVAVGDGGVGAVLVVVADAGAGAFVAALVVALVDAAFVFVAVGGAVVAGVGAVVFAFTLFLELGMVAVYAGIKLVEHVGLVRTSCIWSRAWEILSIGTGLLIDSARVIALVAWVHAGVRVATIHHSVVIVADGVCMVTAGLCGTISSSGSSGSSSVLIIVTVATRVHIRINSGICSVGQVRRMRPSGRRGSIAIASVVVLVSAGRICIYLGVQFLHHGRMVWILR